MAAFRIMVDYAATLKTGATRAVLLSSRAVAVGDVHEPGPGGTRSRFCPASGNTGSSYPVDWQFFGRYGLLLLTLATPPTGGGS